jgi:uncharacterized repeat protein (TIGR01451 family)
MYVTRELSYPLTTTVNPVQPGQKIQFTVTVTNLSTATQTVRLNYDVPQLTTAVVPPAGTAFFILWAILRPTPSSPSPLA